MNIKSFIAVMGVGLSVLSACTSEEIIERPTATTGSVSLVFSVSDAQTKATPAPDYDYATKDELTIQNATIAVFNAEDICVGFAKDPRLTTTKLTVNEVELPAYSASLENLPVNESLRFVVIANSTNKFESFGIGSSYSDLEVYQETSNFPYAVGLAKKLVKVGEVTETLSSSATAVSVTVPLTSLSARIDFGGITSEYDEDVTVSLDDVYGNWEQMEYEKEDKSIMDELLKNVENYNTIQGSNYKKWGDGNKDKNFVDDNSWHCDKNFYYYTPTRRGTVYRISFYKQEYQKNGQSISKKGVVWDNKIGLEGANKLAYLLSLDQSPYQKGSVQDCADTTFYTYPSSTSFNLTFTLNCGIGQSTNTKYDKYIRYAYVIQERKTRRGDSWYSPSRSSKDNSSSPYPDGDVVVSFSQNKATSHLKPLQDTFVEQISNPGSTAPSYQACQLTIPGNSIKSGHLYRVTGKYSPSISGYIEWQVADWTENREINIGFGQ